MEKIKISIGNNEFKAFLYETPTAKSILKALPFKAKVNTWGDEIYCIAPVDCDLEEGAKAEVDIGKLAYWPNMPAFCIFFGQTPLSSGEKPVAAGPVNVFGRLEKIDIDILRQVEDGEEILVELI